MVAVEHRQIHRLANLVEDPPHVRLGVLSPQFGLAIGGEPGELRADPDPAGRRGGRH
jgi:hypothetical protein